MRSDRLKSILVWLVVFSIAMGYLESSVVVYLRRLYYPEGFAFPLRQLPVSIATIEIGREAATIIMLTAVAWIAGKSFRQKLSVFMICFATWDLFYYVFLKVLSGWPESLLTWDVLFLIPTVWAGPVIAPVLVSITLLAIAGILLFYSTNAINRRFRNISTMLLAGGFVLIFLSFILDFLRFAINRTDLSMPFMTNINSLTVQQYIPSSFNWYVFSSGEFLLITWVLQHLYSNRMLKKKRDAC